MVNPADICFHENPAWPERGDWELMCDLTSSGMPGRWEQMRAEEITKDRYLICCIPFFAYGLSLGDEVSTQKSTIFGSIVGDVIRSSDLLSLRVAVIARESADHIRDQVLRKVHELDLEHETHAARYVAVSCPRSASETRELIDMLTPLQAGGVIQFEFSRDPDS